MFYWNVWILISANRLNSNKGMKMKSFSSREQQLRCDIQIFKETHNIPIAVNLSPMLFNEFSWRCKKKISQEESRFFQNILLLSTIISLRSLTLAQSVCNFPLSVFGANKIQNEFTTKYYRISVFFVNIIIASLIDFCTTFQTKWAI